MTAQGMLDAIIQAMDERLAPVIDRLDDLEERIRRPGGLPAGYEETLAKSIDARLAPVLERLGRVEDQLRLSVPVPGPEARYVTIARTFAEDEDLDGDGYGGDGYREERELVPEDDDLDEDLACPEDFSYPEEEREQDARDLGALLERLEEMEERLLAQEDAAKVLLAMPKR